LNLWNLDVIKPFGRRSEESFKLSSGIKGYLILRRSRSIETINRQGTASYPQIASP